MLVSLPVQSEEAASAKEEVDYNELGGRICALYVRSRDVTASVKRAIYSFLKEREKMIDPSPAEVLAKLNAHKHELTCDGGKHIINVALTTKAISGGETSTRDINALKKLIVNDFGGLRYEELPASEIEAFEATSGVRDRGFNRSKDARERADFLQFKNFRIRPF
jgi:hypothetical protein